MILQTVSFSEACVYEIHSELHLLPCLYPSQAVHVPMGAHEPSNMWQCPEECQVLLSAGMQKQTNKEKKHQGNQTTQTLSVLDLRNFFLFFPFISFSFLFFPCLFFSPYHWPGWAYTYSEDKDWNERLQWIPNAVVTLPLLPREGRCCASFVYV